jgi:hypothetical protein
MEANIILHLSNEKTRGRVDLAHLVRFIVVELTYLDLNLYLRLIILSMGGDVPVDSETFLLTDFIDLKIKPTQSFKCTYRGMMCVYSYR